jgi:cytochrome b6-f complex iron-sulfur subunit
MSNPELAPPPKYGRRSFLNKLWAVLGIAACAEFFWLAGSILQSSKKQTLKNQAEALVDAGFVDTFSPGTVTAIPRGQFYIACLEDRSFIALSKTCTHLGCSLPWDEKQHKFICPCHGSSFVLRGVVLTAPAVRPLDIYPIRIENGLIRVDTTIAVRREGFESSQTVSV